MTFCHISIGNRIVNYNIESDYADNLAGIGVAATGDAEENIKT